MEIIQMGLTKYMTPANLGQEIRNRKRQRDSKHERLGMSLLALKMKGGSVAMQVVSRNWEQISLTVSKDQGTSVLSLKELYLPQPRKLGRGPRATDWLQPDQNLDFSFQDARQRTQSCLLGLLVYTPVSKPVSPGLSCYICDIIHMLDLSNLSHISHSLFNTFHLFKKNLWALIPVFSTDLIATS